MRDIIPFVIIGLAAGSVYAIAGMGLVLTYKISGIFNFAHGAVATVGGYALYELSVRQGLPWPVAVAISLVVVGWAMGILLERIAHRLSDVSLTMKIVGTVGLLVAIQALIELIYGTAALRVEQFLPTATFEVLGIFVGLDQLIIIMLAIAVAIGLSAFFSRARLGLAMRAVVDDDDLLELSNHDARRVRTKAWVLGSMFASLSGILLVPTVGVEATVLTLLVVQAFGAAAIGGFSSLPLTYAGGLAIGVLSSLATQFTRTAPLLSRVPPALPFIILFVVLLVRRRESLFDVDAGRVLEYASERLGGPGWNRTLLMLLGGLLLFIPTLIGPRLPVYTNAIILAIIFLSLDLLVRTSGQVSLAHAAFVAVGAATFGQLTSSTEIPWLLALAAAGISSMVVAAFVGIPAIRLSGLYLAIATFGFGIMVEFMFYQTPLMFGAGGEALVVPRPYLGFLPTHTDAGFYYVCLGIFAAIALAVWGISAGRLGRLLRALASSPTTLTTLGTETSTTRVLVFSLSGFIAGVAGGLTGALSGFTSGRGLSWLVSLEWLVMLAVIICHVSGVWAAILFGVGLSVIPGYLGVFGIETYLSLLVGVFAVLYSFSNGNLRRPEIPHRIGEGFRDRRSSPVIDRMRSGLAVKESRL